MDNVWLNLPLIDSQGRLRPRPVERPKIIKRSGKWVATGNLARVPMRWAMEAVNWCVKMNGDNTGPLDWRELQ